MVLLLFNSLHSISKLLLLLTQGGTGYMGAPGPKGDKGYRVCMCVWVCVWVCVCVCVWAWCVCCTEWPGAIELALCPHAHYTIPSGLPW